MTRAAVTAIARRYKLGALVDVLLEEYAERMAICTVDGGLSEAEADRVAMEDCERYAKDLDEDIAVQADLANGGGR